MFFYIKEIYVLFWKLNFVLFLSHFLVNINTDQCTHWQSCFSIVFSTWKQGRWTYLDSTFIFNQISTLNQRWWKLTINVVSTLIQRWCVCWEELGYPKEQYSLWWIPSKVKITPKLKQYVWKMIASWLLYLITWSTSSTPMIFLLKSKEVHLP